jgi:hypothetical protein
VDAVSLEKLVSDRIEEAMSEGEFDNLPGEGKPLDLDWYFQLPEHLRLTCSVLRNAGLVPQEVELLREIGELRERLALTPDAGDKERVFAQINHKTLAFNLLIERTRNRR